MNGALYISFFQGQLESALEQVVQLAVTEITGTVGASLSAMLLETARKEQENQRLRASIQSPRRLDAEPQRAAPRPGSSSPVPQSPGSHPDSLRQEQKRRAVGQLKVVMERVLEFAKCELSKIVEDSFDDVLLELRKTERENEELREKLRGRLVENQPGDAEKNEPPGDVVGSPKSTDLVKDVEEKADKDEQGMEQMQSADADSACPAVISVSHDWVPVLDQVFGQKWCADIWLDKEPEHVKVDRPHLPSGEPVRKDSAPERKDDSQLDQPQWLQDAEALTVTFNPQQTSETSSTGDDVPLKSPSMLHRLLTLPTQLLDGDDESMESEESLLNAITSLQSAQTPLQGDPARADDPDTGEDLEDQEDDDGQEEGSKPRSCKSGRKNHVCKTCGRKFSRAHLLKSHRLTHREARSPFSKLHTPASTDSEKNT
ncbi:uncharacterized protein Hap1MRO34_004034 isoform 1-T1 [Clarias gariepinus]